MQVKICWQRFSSEYLERLLHLWYNKQVNSTQTFVACHIKNASTMLSHILGMTISLSVIILCPAACKCLNWHDFVQLLVHSWTAATPAWSMCTMSEWRSAWNTHWSGDQDGVGQCHLCSSVCCCCQGAKCKCNQMIMQRSKEKVT